MTVGKTHPTLDPIKNGFDNAEFFHKHEQYETDVFRIIRFRTERDKMDFLSKSRIYIKKTMRINIKQKYIIIFIYSKDVVLVLNNIWR